MSRRMTIRLPDETLARVDEERRRAGLTRAAAVNEALELWVERRRYEDAVRRDHAGYAKYPVQDEEFGPVLASLPTGWRPPAPRAGTNTRPRSGGRRTSP